MYNTYESIKDVLTNFIRYIYQEGIENIDAEIIYFTQDSTKMRGKLLYTCPFCTT